MMNKFIVVDVYFIPFHECFSCLKSRNPFQNIPSLIQFEFDNHFGEVIEDFKIEKVVIQNDSNPKERLEDSENHPQSISINKLPLGKHREFFSKEKIIWEGSCTLFCTISSNNHIDIHQKHPNQGSIGQGFEVIYQTPFEVIPIPISLYCGGPLSLLVFVCWKFYPQIAELMNKLIMGD